MRWYPHHPLTSIQQCPFKLGRQVSAILDPPHHIGTKNAPSPPQRLQVPDGGSFHRQLGKFAAGIIDTDQRVGGFMRINSHDNHATAPRIPQIVPIRPVRRRQRCWGSSPAPPVTPRASNTWVTPAEAAILLESRPQV